MRATLEAITASINLYFNGESLRHVADSMKLFGVKISYKGVEGWVKKIRQTHGTIPRIHHPTSLRKMENG